MTTAAEMTAEPVDTIDPAADPATDPAVRADDARALVKRFSLWSAGAGLLPFPVLDMALMTGVQVKMIYHLSKMYDIPFSENRAKAVVGSLVSTVVPGGAAMGVVGSIGSLVKSIPVVGTLVGLVVTPAVGYAVTYAVGRVFMQHFETGGTLLNFKPEEMREHFKAEFEAAKADAPASTEAAKAEAAGTGAPTTETTKTGDTTTTTKTSTKTA